MSVLICFNPKFCWSSRLASSSCFSCYLCPESSRDFFSSPQYIALNLNLIVCEGASNPRVSDMPTHVDTNSRIFQAESQVQHIILFVIRFRQYVVVFWRDDDMACRARDGSFACA